MSELREKEIELVKTAIEQGDRYVLSRIFWAGMADRALVAIALLLCFLIAKSNIGDEGKYGFYGVSAIATGGSLIGRKNG